MSEQNQAQPLLLSEAFKQKLLTKVCPYAQTCQQQITLYHFQGFCNTQNYNRCLFFARQAGETKTPLNWIRKVAMAQKV